MVISKNKKNKKPSFPRDRRKKEAQTQAELQRRLGSQHQYVFYSKNRALIEKEWDIEK